MWGACGVRVVVGRPGSTWDVMEGFAEPGSKGCASSYSGSMGDVSG